MYILVRHCTFMGLGVTHYIRISAISLLMVLAVPFETEGISPDVVKCVQQTLSPYLMP